MNAKYMTCVKVKPGLRLKQGRTISCKYRCGEPLSGTNHLSSQNCYVLENTKLQLLISGKAILFSCLTCWTFEFFYSFLFFMIKNIIEHLPSVAGHFAFEGQTSMYLQVTQSCLLYSSVRQQWLHWHTAAQAAQGQ